MAPGRDRAVEKCQRRAIVERADLGHEARKQVERPIRLCDEAGECLPPVAAFHIVAALDQRTARRVRLVGWRQEGQRRMVAALEVRPRALEPRAPFLVNQPPPGIEKNRSTDRRGRKEDVSTYRYR